MPEIPGESTWSLMSAFAARLVPAEETDTDEKAIKNYKRAIITHAEKVESKHFQAKLDGEIYWLKWHSTWCRSGSRSTWHPGLITPSFWFPFICDDNNVSDIELAQIYIYMDSPLFCKLKKFQRALSQFLGRHRKSIPAGWQRENMTLDRERHWRLVCCWWTFRRNIWSPAVLLTNPLPFHGLKHFGSKNDRVLEKKKERERKRVGVGSVICRRRMIFHTGDLGRSSKCITTGLASWKERLVSELIHKTDTRTSSTSSHINPIRYPLRAHFFSSASVEHQRCARQEVVTHLSIEQTIKNFLFFKKKGGKLTTNSWLEKWS